MYKRFFFIVSFSCINCWLPAQVIVTGTIYDEKNNPVEFANIVLTDVLDNKFIKGTVSDEKGFFEIDIKKNKPINISIQYIGYENWEKAINSNSSLALGKINLTPASENLTTVTVTADRPIIEKTNEKIIFNISSSPLRSDYDGMEVLERAPNIWIGENDQILIRNESAIIMVNGRRINMSGSDLANYLSNLQSDEIKSIEIQTIASANVDAENSGGIINIILKKKRIGFSGIARADRMENGGGYFRNYAGININYGTPNWNIYGNYNYTNRLGANNILAEIFYKKTGNYLRNAEDYERDDRGHRLRFGMVTDVAKNHQIGAEFYGRSGAYDVQRESDFSMTNADQVIDEGIIVGETMVDNYTVNGIINYSWQLDSLNSKFNVVADYTRYEQEDDTDVVSTYELDVYEGLLEKNQFQAGTEIYVAQADLIKNFISGIQLEMGGRYTAISRADELLSTTLRDETWTVNDRTATIHYDERVAATYTAISKNINKTTFIKFGLRMERTALERLDVLENEEVQQNYTNWFPSFYFSKTTKKGQVLSASYTRRLRRPSFVALGSKVVKINDFNYRAGNPGLRPEFFGKYSLDYLMKKHQFAVYFNTVKDAINGIYLLDGEITTYQQFNNGAQRQYGFTYNWTGQLFEWWYFSPSADVFYREFINEENIAMFGQTSYRLKINNNFKINKTTGIDFSGRYFSAKKDAFYEAAARYEANIIFKKSFLNKKLNARIYVHDIFNTRRFINRRPFAEFETRNDRDPRSTGVTFYLTYHFSNSHKTSGKTNKSGNDAVNRL